MDRTKAVREWALILLITLALYTLLCLWFQGLLNSNERTVDVRQDTNLIRATYPNYRDENFEHAQTIFEEYAAPGAEYRSFVGYRRTAFSGKAVSVNAQGFRVSINHSTNDSVWFLGGSTMWGTGADDARTIPSLFANKTGEQVLNLGESGFHSLQELIQMQILLSEGFSPKEVIFYDGVNDGYYFCQRDSGHQVRHAYTSRWQTLESDFAKARVSLNEKPMIDAVRLKSFFLKLYSAPALYFKEIEDKRENLTKHTSSTPLHKIKRTEAYLHCTDPDYAEKAVNILLSSWRAAAAILNERNIPVWFVLQPAAVYRPERYKLGHIIDYEKQRIVNEMASYEIFYDKVTSEFKRTCSVHGDCNAFLNLSDLFFDMDEHFFIDTCHLSPNGNEIVVDKLVLKIRGQSKNKSPALDI